MDGQEKLLMKIGEQKYIFGQKEKEGSKTMGNKERDFRGGDILQWRGGGREDLCRRADANEDFLQIIIQEQSHKDLEVQSVPVSCVFQKVFQEIKEKGLRVAKHLS